MVTEDKPTEMQSYTCRILGTLQNMLLNLSPYINLSGNSFFTTYYSQHHHSLNIYIKKLIIPEYMNTSLIIEAISSIIQIKDNWGTVLMSIHAL